MSYRLRSLALAVGVVIAFSGLAPTGALGGAVRVTLVPYLDSGYKFKVVAHDEGVGFEQPGFDDSSFGLGDAGFGTADGGCILNNSQYVNTPWPSDTDILLRKSFDLPPGATRVRVGVAIDNQVQVFVNGQDVSGGLQNPSDCIREGLLFDVPDALVAPGPNLLAVRGRDLGGPDYLDVRVSANVSIHQVPLRRTARVEEFGPAGDDGHLAWAQIARRGAATAYVKPNGESPIKLNAARMAGALGGIDDETLVYQQFHPTKHKSDLKFFDLFARRRSNPPTGVNTRLWEYWPSISGDWLLFGRYRRSGLREIVLHNMASGEERVLSRTGRDMFSAPGQVNGNFATWYVCAVSGCSVGLHDISANASDWIPNSRPWQYGASVAEDGTVFFERETNGCRARGQLVAYPPGGPPVVVMQFGRAHGAFGPYVFTGADGKINVLYSSGRICGSRLDEDLFKVVIPRPIAMAGERGSAEISHPRRTAVSNPRKWNALLSFRGLRSAAPNRFPARRNDR